MTRHPRRLADESSQPTLWQRWLRQPQNIWLRRTLFQVHLWSGITIVLYILTISVTGSVVVFQNELLRSASQESIISKGSGQELTDVKLNEYTTHMYPSYTDS